MKRAAGSVAFGVVTAAVGGACAAVGAAGLLTPGIGGFAIGLGAVVVVAELAALSRLSPTVSLVVGGVAAGVVVVAVEGVVEVGLPTVVVGAGLGLVLSSWWRYAEHVIAVEGPHRVAAAIAARWWVPARDLTLALSGRPLREQPALPPFDGRGSFPAHPSRGSLVDKTAKPVFSPPSTPVRRR